MTIPDDGKPSRDESLTGAISRLHTVLGYATTIANELNAAIGITSKHAPAESEERNVMLDRCLRSLEARVTLWSKKTGQAYDLLGYPSPDNIGQASRMLAIVQTEMGEHSETDTIEEPNYPKLTDEEIDQRIESLLSLWKWRLSHDSYHPRTREGLLAHEALCLRDKVGGLLTELRAAHAKLELPFSTSRSAPVECDQEFVTDEPPYLRLVSSIRTAVAGAHTRVFIWNRGALAGELLMSQEDAELLCSALGLKPKDQR